MLEQLGGFGGQELCTRGRAADTWGDPVCISSPSSVLDAGDTPIALPSRSLSQQGPAGHHPVP